MVEFSSPVLYIHLLIATLILTVPGMAIYFLAMRLLRREPMRGTTESVLAGIGLSIAFWPLLLLYLTLTGLSIAPWLLWVLLFLFGLYVLFEMAWHQYNRRQDTLASARRTIERRVTALALVALVLLVLAFRLNDVQGLSVPLFGDSLHHTMITQMIIDHGQVPSGYLPYAPVDTFTYHFGFHTLAAIFAQMTGSGAPYSVLLIGQVLNALAVPLAYMFNRDFFSSRLAGLGAAVITGVVSIMPAFYVNWGRYTQLAGQLLLMVALVFLVRVMLNPGDRAAMALCALCVAGLVVVHYRVLIFFGLFAIAVAVLQLLGGWRRLSEVIVSWARGIAAVLVGLVIALPWIINIATNYLPGLTGRLSSVTSDYLALYNNPGTITFYLGVAVPVLAFAGFLAGIASLVLGRGTGEELEEPESTGLALDTRSTPVTLRPFTAVLVLGVWVLLLVASLWVVPGAIGSYAIALTLYIPLAALGGYGVGQICDWLGVIVRVPRAAFAGVIVLAAPVLGFAMGTWHVADPGRYAYVHPADVKGFDWIKANTPPDSKFLISSEFTYSGRGVTASDGGMWLPLLAGRTVSLPALSAWMERPIARDFFTNTKRLAAYTQPPSDATQVDASNQARLITAGVISATHTLQDSATLELMKELGITHVYVGAAGGSSKPRLDVAMMRRDGDHFKLLYTDQGVYVFQVMYP